MASLQDQLLKAGMVDKKKAKQIAQQKKKQAKQQAKQQPKGSQVINETREQARNLIENKKANSLDVLDKKIKTLNNFLNFKQAITKNKNVSLITEIKKASPSAGIIVKNYNPLEIANVYNINNVTCLSVLT